MERLFEREIPSIDHIREHPGEAHARMWSLQMEATLIAEENDRLREENEELVRTSIGYLDPEQDWKR